MSAFLGQNILLITLTLIGGFIVWTRWMQPRLAGVEGVSAEEYWRELRKEPHLLLDVRTPQEYAAGHAPGSLNIPLQEMHMRMNEIPKDRSIVCICRSGQRSGVAATHLARAGHAPVYNLSGGMMGWSAARLPMGRG